MSNQSSTSSSQSQHWEEFYATHLPPSDFEDNRSLLKEFCARHKKIQNNIVLVTVSFIQIRKTNCCSPDSPIYELLILDLWIVGVCNFYSLVVLRSRWNTIPSGLWTTLAPAHVAPLPPNTSWNMATLSFSCIAWSRWSHSHDISAANNSSTCWSWATMVPVRRSQVRGNPVFKNDISLKLSVLQWNPTQSMCWRRF